MGGSRPCRLYYRARRRRYGGNEGARRIGSARRRAGNAPGNDFPHCPRLRLRGEMRGMSRNRQRRGDGRWSAIGRPGPPKKRIQNRSRLFCSRFAHLACRALPVCDLMTPGRLPHARENNVFSTVRVSLVRNPADIPEDPGYKSTSPFLPLDLHRLSHHGTFYANNFPIDGA